MPSTANIPAKTHAFKGLRDWIEVFRAGDHVDSKGRRCSFTEADLDQMVANLAVYEPPAVLGHPNDNDPAYARVKEAKRDGQGLFVKFGDIDAQFEAAVDSGKYRNRSVSVFKDAEHGWCVRHVGWLGAVPPAVLGMKPLDYSAPAHAEDFHEFAASTDHGLTLSWALDDAASLLRSLRDWLISKDGLEVANTVLPDWRITSIGSAANTIRDASKDEPTSYSTGDDPMSFTQADLDRAAEEAAARAKTEAEARFAQQQQELQTIRGERQTERISTQIANWKAAGLVLPAEEPGLSEFMAALENGSGAEFSFSRGEGQEPGKKNPAQWFHDFVASRKPLVKLNQRTEDLEHEPVDLNDANAIVTAARAYQYAQKQQGITVSDEHAVEHIKSTHGAK